MRKQELKQLQDLVGKLLSAAEPATGGDEAEATKAEPRRRHKPSAIKYLTEAEASALFHVITGVRDRAMFRVAYHRGLRASEIGTLQYSDYRQRDDRIVVSRLKGSSGGEYHLTSSEVRALKAWVKIRGSAPGPLFPSRRGRGISRKMLDVLMKRYGRLAGLPEEKCHMHALKHSCGTHLMNRGESIEDVQDHLGHRNIQNTLIYARFTNKRRQERDRRLRDW